MGGEARLVSWPDGHRPEGEVGMLTESRWAPVQGQVKVHYVPVASHERKFVRVDGNIPPSRPAPSLGATVFLLAGAGILGGLIGHSAGKSSGFAEGYNLRAAQDAQVIAQQQEQLRVSEIDRNRLLQENASLRANMELLKGLVRQQPETPEGVAILKAVERVEFRLTKILPSIFEDGGDHNTPQN
jgi:hypothetical protein